MKDRPLFAVLTGDLINSSKLTAQQKKDLFKEIKERFTNDGTLMYFYRGDSFQIQVNRPEEALQLALQIKAYIFQKTAIANARIAIGIGPIESPNEDISAADGTAYRLSGPILDQMKKKKQTIMVRFEDTKLNEEFIVYCTLLDALLDHWKRSTSETISLLLQGYNEEAMATRLKISQPAVNSRKKTAQWDAIRTLLKRYVYIVAPKK